MSPSLSRPLYVTDGAGVAFHVLDVLSGPPELPWGHTRVVAPGHPHAHFRLLVAPIGVVYLVTVGRDPWGDRRPYCPDPTDLAAPWLRQQLEEARRAGPDAWGAEMLREAREAHAAARETVRREAEAGPGPEHAPPLTLHPPAPLPDRYVAPHGTRRWKRRER
jgi:hypothetical protein